MDELRECPFCGGEGLLIEHSLIMHPDYKFFTAGCSGDCQLEMNEFSTRNEAIAAWNRRHTPKPEPLTLEQLREMDEERVWVQYKDIGMYALVSYLTDEEYSADKDFEEVMLTNSLGGRSSYHDILFDGGIVYTSKPEME